MILDQTYRLIRDRHSDILNGLKISDVRVGQFLTAVLLSDGSIGTASSLEDDHPFCLKADRDFGEFTPLKIKGQEVTRLFETGKTSRLVSSLRTAAISAISSRIISSGKYRVVDDCDPVELIDLSGGKSITIVGAFQSYIQKIAATPNRLRVLEMNRNAFRPEQEKYFVPANEFRTVIPDSDILIITGQTLVNNTIDDLLSVVRDGTEVVVTGPSGNIMPDILFGNRVTMIGASRYTKPELVFEVVGQGGLGYHLFEYCARKISVLKGNGSETQ
jgi:uncharacterized protein